MIRRAVFAVFVLACVAFFFSLFPAISTSKSPVAEKAKPSAAQPATQKEPAPTTPTAQKEPTLTIEKIYLKGNKIFITINQKTGEKIAPDDFSKIKMRLETSKGLRQWSLAEVDRKKILGGAGAKVDFDTGIVLEKGEMVKAVLFLGKWETSRRDNLVITPASAGTKPHPSKAAASKMTAQGKLPAQTSGQTTMMMAKAVNARSTTPTPTPRNLDDAGGIRIVVPGEGQTQRPGDSIRVQASFLNPLSNPTAVDYVEFALRKLGVSDVFATHRQPYRQSSDDRTCVATIRLPATGLPPGSNYYFTATHPEAWGIGHDFTIQSPGEGQIRVLRPNARDGFTPGFTMNVDYQFTRHASEGQINFELYKLDADGRYGSPVATRTRHYRSSAGSPAEPIHMLEWQLPRDLPVGQYFVQATHPEAWGRSSNFSVRWEGEGHDLPSDYAVADIFKHGGNEIKARIRATGGDIADYVELNVNGVLRREIIRPSRDTDIVIGEIPPESICGASYGVTIDPNNRIRETNRDNNHLDKFVPFRGANGYAMQISDHEYGSTANYIPCNGGFIYVRIKNCSSDSVPVGVEVRQMGWLSATLDRPETQLNRVVRHGLYVDDCHFWGELRPGTSIPTGECATVRVNSEDLQKVNGSILVFTFRGGMTAWPSLTNPLNIKLIFGNWATTINSRTGETTRECVYHEEPHP